MWDQSLIDGPIPMRDYAIGLVLGVPGLAGLRNGYHLNVPPELVTSKVEPFRIYPKTPERVFAGDAEPWTTTAFLRFENEWSARAVLGAYWRDELADLRDNLRQGPILRLGSDADALGRADILLNLEGLEKAASELSPPTGWLGHNNPPGFSEAAAIAAIKEAAALIRAELGNATPNVVRVVEAAQQLDSLGRAVDAAEREARSFGSKVIDKVKEKAADAIVAGGTTLVVLHSQAVLGQMSNVIHAVSKWLAVLLGW